MIHEWLEIGRIIELAYHSLPISGQKYMYNTEITSIMVFAYLFPD